MHVEIREKESGINTNFALFKQQLAIIDTYIKSSKDQLLPPDYHIKVILLHH